MNTNQIKLEKNHINNLSIFYHIDLVSFNWLYNVNNLNISSKINYIIGKKLSRFVSSKRLIKYDDFKQWFVSWKMFVKSSSNLSNIFFNTTHLLLLDNT